MEIYISLKTGIEHRFTLREFKSTVKLPVLLGKLRNFIEFSHEIFKYCLIQFNCFTRCFQLKNKVKSSQKQCVSILLSLENEKMQGTYERVLSVLLYSWVSCDVIIFSGGQL